MAKAIILVIAPELYLRTWFSNPLLEIAPKTFLLPDQNKLEPAQLLPTFVNRPVLCIGSGVL
jgi:hypothetical protein